MRKKKLLLISLCSAMCLMSSACSWITLTDSSDTSSTESSEVKKETKKSKEKASAKPRSKETTKPKVKETAKPKPKKTKKPRKNSTGKSDGDITQFDEFHISPVRNDVTGNWKIATIAESEFEPEKFALSYYNKYFKKDEEIHFIVNFIYNTTTSISKLGKGYLRVATMEYDDKEEHDANTLGCGTLINEFFVYTDNGDIEKIQ